MAERLRQKFTELKARLNEAEARSECFKESLNEVNKRIDSAEATAAMLRQQATSTEAEIKRISSRLENIEGELWSTGESLKRNERAMDNLAQEEEQMNAKQNTLHEKLKTVKDTVTINESKLNEASRRIKVVELQKKLAEKRCERLSELEGQLNARLLQVNKTMEEFQSSSRKGMSEEEEQALNQKIEDLKSSYVESEAKADLAQRKIAALSCKRNALESELQEINAKKEWAKDELNRVYHDMGI
ncbi:tropomyosin-like [Stylophora pistillata]|uniref:tropomyosin-like n=1 Tax=Stylophora pistillata TaxID=50429 RepID=UPI000C0532ED|nr:tropomyosin-like [Stylophora pistillata]